MRHGFGAMHSYFWGGSGISIGMVILLVALLAAIVVIVALIRRKKHPEHDRLLDILKGKQADGTIGESEYRERSLVLGDEYWIEANGPEMLKLKELYAHCEIDSREYVKQRAELFDQRSYYAGETASERSA